VLHLSDHEIDCGLAEFDGTGLPIDVKGIVVSVESVAEFVTTELLRHSIWPMGDDFDQIGNVFSWGLLHVIPEHFANIVASSMMMALGVVFHVDDEAEE